MHVTLITNKPSLFDEILQSGMQAGKGELLENLAFLDLANLFDLSSTSRSCSTSSSAELCIPLALSLSAMDIG